MAKYAANFMTDARLLASYLRSKRGRHYPNRSRELPRDHWGHVFYDYENLKSRFSFWLDNLPGPVGGHLDMLRLHRFKTLNTGGIDFFARQNRNSVGAASLWSAAFELNRRLATLFNPLAPEHILPMRDSCPHFRAVEWATAPPSETDHDGCRSDEIWLKYYPKGIRYHWGRRNLVEWRLHWRTEGYRRWEKTYYPKGHPYHRNVRLCQWWECVASCEETGAILIELAQPKERENLQWSFRHMARLQGGSKERVVVRRDRTESVVRCVRKGCGYTIYSYSSMAVRCWWWFTWVKEKPFYDGAVNGLPSFGPRWRR